MIPPASSRQLPSVQYPFTSENFGVARSQTVDYIAFVASTYPLEWAEREIYRAARRPIYLINSEYEQAARKLLGDTTA